MSDRDQKRIMPARRNTELSRGPHAQQKEREGPEDVGVAVPEDERDEAKAFLK